MKPKAVSISIREMLSEGETAEIARFYQEQWEAGVGIQHILYDTDDMHLLQDLGNRGIVPKQDQKLLFVLGRYSTGQISDPNELQPFLSALKQLEQDWSVASDWALCAFGQTETDCLIRAFAAGGKGRIGFENNLYHSDGRLARDNADRISHLLTALPNSEK